MEAGRLRHRINIERPVSPQSSTGAPEPTTWEDVFGKTIAAEVAPLSAREFITANQIQSAIAAKITIRYFPGLTAEMRIIFRGKIYNIAGVLPDNNSGLEHISFPVQEGVNAG